MKKLESNIRENQVTINEYKVLARQCKEKNEKIDSYKYINDLIPLQTKNKNLLNIWNVMYKNDKKKATIDMLKSIQNIMKIIGSFKI